MSLLKNRLAECLAAKRMNQSWLAGRLHMSRAYVSRLVRGDIQPSIIAAIRIARFLGKPVEHVFELIEADGRPSPSSKQFPGAFPSASVESTQLAEINKQTTMKGKTA
jgi:DNA-binding XRE family transcriptional regulator